MTEKEEKEYHVIFYILLALSASVHIAAFCVITDNMKQSVNHPLALILSGVFIFAYLFIIFIVFNEPNRR
jgi:hypothetical protein